MSNQLALKSKYIYGIGKQYNDELLKKIDSFKMRDGILTGKAGYLLLLHALYKKSNSIDYYRAVEKLSSDLINDIDNKRFINGSYAEGLIGVFYSMHKIINNNYYTISNSQFELIDEYVYKWTEEKLLNQDFDFMYGGMGGFFYLMGRVDNSDVNRIRIKNLINCINNSSIKHLNSIHFINKNRNFNGDYIATGLAHGMLSIPILLLRACNANIEVDLCRTIIYSIINFYDQLYNDRLNNDKQSIFPQYINNNTNSKEYIPKLAWCNGDLIIGYTYVVIGKYLNDKDYLRNGIEILKKTVCRKNYEQTGITNIEMCHGSSGVSYIYKKLYDKTGLELFYDSYSYWFEVTYDKIFNADKYLYKVLENNFSILDGLTGVMLSIDDDFEINSLLSDFMLLD
ncbi:lanthionine synthetase LanC family protein [Spirosoma lituiforme]